MAGEHKTSGNGNGNGSAKWLTIWLPVGASAVVVFGTLFTFFSEVGSMNSDISGLKSTNGQYERRLDRLEGEVAAVQIFQAAQKASDCEQFAKVETQFGTIETALNQVHVDELRSRAAIWNKVYGEPYSSAYYAIEIPHEVTPC